MSRHRAHFLAVALCLTTAGASAEDAVPVRLAGEVVFQLRCAGDYPDIETRAEAVTGALNDLVAAYQDLGAPDVRVTTDPDPALHVDDRLILRVWPGDLPPGQTDLVRLAGRWQVELQAALLKAIPPIVDLQQPAPADVSADAGESAGPDVDDHDPNLADGSVVDVMVSSAVVARIRARGEASSVRERGALIDARITDIISYQACDKPDLRIVEERGIPAIYVGPCLLMRVYPADAAPNGCTPTQMAQAWRTNLLEWLPKAHSMAARPGSAGPASRTACVEPQVGDAGRADLPPGAYTGLIIDATGLGAERTIAPRIVTPDGVEIWGTVNCSAGFAVGTGIAGWAHGLQEAGRCERAGDNPLIVRAQQVLGAARCVFQVAAHDARRIQAAGRISGFLKCCNVVVAQ